MRERSAGRSVHRWNWPKNNQHTRPVLKWLCYGDATVSDATGFDRSHMIRVLKVGKSVPRCCVV